MNNTKWIMVDSGYFKPLLMLDLIQKSLNSKESKIKSFLSIEGCDFISLKDFQKVEKEVITIIKSKKKLANYLDEAKNEYQTLENSSNMDSLKQLNMNELKTKFNSFVEAQQTIFRKYYYFLVVHNHVKKIIIEYLQKKIPGRDVYSFFDILARSTKDSMRFQEHRDIINFAYAVERNKTLKKSFTSSPEKIIDKIRTFYINLHNTLIAHNKKYSWKKSNYLDYCICNEIEIVRDIKYMIKESNIKREYLDMQQYLKVVKRETNKTIKLIKPSKKILSLIELMKDLNYLKQRFSEIMTLFYYSYKPLFDEIGKKLKLDYNVLIEMKINEIKKSIEEHNVKGYHKICERDRTFSIVFNKNRVKIMKSIASWKSNQFIIPGIANSGKKIKGKIADKYKSISKNDILLLNQYPSNEIANNVKAIILPEKAIVIEDVFIFWGAKCLFKILRNGQTVTIDGSKSILKNF